MSDAHVNSIGIWEQEVSVAGLNMASLESIMSRKLAGGILEGYLYSLLNFNIALPSVSSFLSVARHLKMLGSDQKQN